MFPFHLNLGFRIIPFYEGLYFLLSIVLGYIVGQRRFKAEGLVSPKMDNMVLVALLAAIIGTRLSHFLFWDWAALVADPLILIRPLTGGASIVGGLIFGFGGAFIGCRIWKIDFFRMFASISPAILLAQAVGRIGCFLNGDAFGLPTDLPWGVRFARYGITIPGTRELHSNDYNSPAWRYSADLGLVDDTSTRSAPLHPTQIYEILADAVLITIIVLLYRNLKKRGASYRPIFFIHAGGYALARGLLEFIRADREQVIGGAVSVLQIFLFAFAAASLVIIAVDLLKKPKQAPQA